MYTEVEQELNSTPQIAEVINEALSDGAYAARIEEDIIDRWFKSIPEKMLNLGTRILIVVVMLFAGMFLIKILRKVIKKGLKKAGADQGLVSFIDSFIKIFLYVVLIMLLATTLGVDATSIVAILGSAGIAIGLALQGALSNFAGGILILLMKPFKVGDYIIEDTKLNEGTVTEINVVYTKLLTNDNKIVVIPNGTLAGSSLTNITANPQRRVNMSVDISYESDIRTAKKVILDTIRGESFTFEEPTEPIVYVEALGQSGVTIGYRVYVPTETFLDCKWQLMEDIKYALDENGIEIPYNHVDVHIK